MEVRSDAESLLSKVFWTKEIRLLQWVKQVQWIAKDSTMLKYEFEFAIFLFY